MRRRSRSQMTVPYWHPLRQAQSSMPTARKGSRGRAARRRTVLSNVSLLTGIARRLAKLCPGRPPNASPRRCTMPSIRIVRRADGKCDRVTEALDKNAAPAACFDTSKPACLNIDLDDSTVGRQIDQASPVAAMDPTRNGTAFRTGRHLRARSCHYDDLRGPDLDAIDSKARWCQRRGMSLTAHLR